MEERERKFRGERGRNKKGKERNRKKGLKRKRGNKIAERKENKKQRAFLGVHSSYLPLPNPCLCL